MAPHSSILAWRIPRTEEPGGLQSMVVAKSRSWWTWLRTQTGMHMGCRWEWRELSWVGGPLFASPRKERRDSWWVGARYRPVCPNTWSEANLQPPPASFRPIGFASLEGIASILPISQLEPSASPQGFARGWKKPLCMIYIFKRYSSVVFSSRGFCPKTITSIWIHYCKILFPGMLLIAIYMLITSKSLASIWPIH